jgi:hypothetical protein
MCGVLDEGGAELPDPSLLSASCLRVRRPKALNREGSGEDKTLLSDEAVTYRNNFEKQNVNNCILLDFRQVESGV